VLFLFSFYPETVLFHNLYVNQHVHLCGVLMYASAFTLNFLDLVKNSSFHLSKLHIFSINPENQYLYEAQVRIN